MFPKVKELQEKYQSELSFVLIGDEDGKIQKVYKRFESALQLAFPVVYDSNVFNVLNIEFVPKYIWLTEKGEISAVTGPEEVTVANIEKFISGGRVPSLKANLSEPFATDKLLLMDGNGGSDTDFLFRSVLTLAKKSLRGYIPLSLAYNSKGKFFQTLNVSMDQLYFYAYFGKAWWSVSDSMYGKYYPKPVYAGFNSKDSAVLKNRYSYSFKGQDTANKEVLKKALQNDLSTFFGFVVHELEMQMPCWKVQVVPGMREKLRSKHKTTFYDGDFGDRDYKNVPISEIITTLHSVSDSRDPFIDETGIDFNIDFKVEAPMTVSSILYSEMEKMGLKVVRSTHPMKVIILERK
jgi:hypothetical protein